MRERTCRAFRAEQRNAHRLGGSLLDRLRALIAIERRFGEARGNGVDLDPDGSSSIAMASVIALRAVLDAG